MALIPTCNTPNDGGNIEVSRSDDCSIAHGTKWKLNITKQFTIFRTI